MRTRQSKLADEIRDILAGCFTTQVSDPRVQSVVVTYVKITRDLQLASVYFRVYDQKHPLEEVEQGLQSCKGFLRKNLGDNLELRRVPNLRFFHDDSIDKGSSVESLIQKIKDD